jgi:hypothetical protein
MTSVADAASELVGNPRPVLALDTCVLLDVIRAGMRAQTDVIAIGRRTHVAQRIADSKRDSP